METPEPLPVPSPQLASVPEPDSPADPTAASDPAGGFSLSDEEFQRRVAVVMEAIKDPEKMNRCIAEIHTYLSMFEQGFREMQREMIAGGGPIVMIRKMLFGKK